MWTQRGRGLPFLSPGDLPNPGIELRSPALQADSLPAEPQGKPTLREKSVVWPKKQNSCVYQWKRQRKCRL